MGRAPRTVAGGYVYHVLNRANGDIRIFDRKGDYSAFEKILWEGCAKARMRVLSYCLMPNHWHLVLFPREDGDLSALLHWMTLTHSHRWQAFRRRTGRGHLYQARYKSFLVKDDPHLIAVCRYVERNPLRARLVRKAEEWQWGSLWRSVRGEVPPAMAGEWPVPRPRDWTAFVNRPQTANELSAIRACVTRGQPFGDEGWTERMVRRFRLEPTVRTSGRSAA